MSRKLDLEQSIVESNDLIHEFQTIIRESERPKEKARARREIAEQRELIAGYQAELDKLTGGTKPGGAAEHGSRPRADNGVTDAGNIFISYSHSPQDSDYAHKLAGDLKRRGFEVWIDDRIDYGASWPQVIQEQLDASTAVIVLMTLRSYDSKWVQNELARAQDKGKPIFPLLLEGDNWLAVQATQYVDVRDGKSPPPAFYHRLAQVLSAPGAPTHPPSTPEA